jgi:MtfA peptidase
MQANEILPLLFFFLFIIVIPGFLLTEFVKLLFRDSFITRKEKSLIRYYTLFPQRIDKRTHELLLSKFVYYAQLPSDQKTRFYVRLKLFLASKKFVPREITDVTYEMKALISASAIQLTFGLEKFIFNHFKTIFVYPKSFLSRYDNNYHKGDVNIKGSIAFSFEDFMEGYRDPTDSYNLGLHEMAHALELEYNLKDEYDAFFASYYERWLKSAATELVRMNYGQSDFLRKYASRNVKEFFSVCVENFFERSALMKERLPEIYKHLTLLLNQDPTSVSYSAPVRERHGQPAIIPDVPVLFKTSVSYASFLPNLFLAAIFMLFVFLLKELVLFVFLFILWLGILLFTIGTLKYLCIYPDILVVRPFLSWFAKLKTYRMEDIVSVSFFDGNKQSLKISHIQDGKIFNKSYVIFFDDSTKSQITAHLKLAKVMVKQCR